MVKRLLKFFNLTKVPPLAVEVFNQVAMAATGDFYSHVADDVADEAKRLHLKRILDVGSGPGYLPLNIARRTKDVRIIGVDIDEKMVNKARENAKEFKVSPKRVYFGVGNAERLPVYENEFDFAVSTEVFHHVKDPVKMLNQIHRALKPGAKAWIYDTTSDVSPTHLDAHLDQLRKRLQAGKMNRTSAAWITLLRKREIMFDSFSIRELAGLLEKSKFKQFHFHREGAWVRMTVEKEKAAA
jgi:ubiquinone/menaquinone biosynthesis C-methylase UbiE